MNNAYLHDLFVSEVQDLHSAEAQLIEALPKLAQAVRDEELKSGIEEHLAQTQEHLKRLETIAEELDFDPAGKTCEGMKGLIKEGEEVIKNMKPSPQRDLAIIGAAQRVEHYEIAGYGVTRTLAERMMHDDAADLLQTTLDEEDDADQKLTYVAEGIMDENSDE